MPLIRHYPDPLKLTDTHIYEVDIGVNFLQWLFSEFNSDESLSGKLCTDVWMNGKHLFSSDKDDESLLNFTLGVNDEITIVCRPAGLDPLSVVIIAVIAIVAAVVLAPRPVRPGQADQDKTSPNNQLSAAQNSFRPNQAIPEVFGELIVYPDFIQPSSFVYANNAKIISELFCVGVGTYDITEVRTGETLISDIPSASSTVYLPGATVPADLLEVHRGTNEVDGQVLAPPDEPALSVTNVIDIVTADGVSNTTITLRTGSTAIQDLGLAVGDEIRVEAQQGIFTPIILLLGNFTIAAISGLVITLNTTSGSSGGALQSSITRLTGSGTVDNFVGWFNIPGTDDTRDILFHWRMPQGVRTETGSSLTVQIEFQIQRITAAGVPTGSVFSQTITKTGNTLTPQFDTTTFTPTNTPGMTSGRYRARARRLTNGFNAGASDRVQLEDFVSVTPYTNPNFGDITILHVLRRGNTLAVTSSASRINARAVRRLPQYNRGTGVYNTSTLVATRGFADAVTYSIIVAAGRAATTVNLLELYTIQDALTVNTGRFNFTFDDFDVSLGERVMTMCNAVRVAPYRDGAVWRFTRDETKSVRTALFNRRVMPTRESRQGWQLQRTDDKDSIALTFVDPDTNTERVIYRRVNLTNSTILTDAPGNQPLEINLAGCRNLVQANDRADLEIRRIIYQRRTVNTTVTRDGLLVGLNERVGWVDPNDVELQDGEILGISGTTYDTSERFIPESGVSYFVYVTDNDGNPSNSVACTPRVDTEFGFIASGLSGAYVADDTNQAGSRYFIASSAEHLANDFLVTKRIPQADGSVVLELAEYVPTIYENDAP